MCTPNHWQTFCLCNAVFWLWVGASNENESASRHTSIYKLLQPRISGEFTNSVWFGNQMISRERLDPASMNYHFISLVLYVISLSIALYAELI